MRSKDAQKQLARTSLSSIIVHSLGLPSALLNFQCFDCHVFLDMFFSKVWTHYDVDRSGHIESNELEVLTDK